jgi:hypothetical protein
MQNEANSVTNNKYNLRILELTNILNKILSKLIERKNSKSLFIKTQNLMRILNIHEILMDIYKVKYRKEIHFIMLTKSIIFFEYFTYQNPQNQKIMINYCNIFLDLLYKKLDTSKVLAHIFSFITHKRTQEQLLMIIFERIGLLLKKKDIFLPKYLLTENSTGEPHEDMTETREKLSCNLRLIRTFFYNENSELNSDMQRCTVEHLIYSDALSCTLVPDYFQLLLDKSVQLEFDHENVLGYNKSYLGKKAAEES